MPVLGKWTRGFEKGRPAQDGLRTLPLLPLLHTGRRLNSPVVLPQRKKHAVSLCGSECRPEFPPVWFANLRCE
jgi:hypothetical protein